MTQITLFYIIVVNVLQQLSQLIGLFPIGAGTFFGTFCTFFLVLKIWRQNIKCHLLNFEVTWTRQVFHCKLADESRGVFC
jgi:hypothetical protein